MPLASPLGRVLTLTLDEYQTGIRDVLLRQGVSAYIAGDRRGAARLGKPDPGDGNLAAAQKYLQTYKAELDRGGTTINGDFVSWLEDTTTSLRGELFDAIHDGIDAGKHPSVIAREIADVIDSDAHDPWLVAQTEVARVVTQGERQRYRDTEVSYLQWLVGDKVCDICLEISTTDVGYGPGVYPIDECPEIPVHPGCMCDTAPVVEPMRAGEEGNRFEAGHEAFNPDMIRDAHGRFGEGGAGPDGAIYLDRLDLDLLSFTEKKRACANLSKELPPKGDWKNPRGRDIAQMALDGSNHGTLLTVRDGDDKLQGLAQYEARSGEVNVHYLASVGEVDHVGTDLLSKVISTNPGMSVKLSADAGAKTFYDHIGMTCEADFGPGLGGVYSWTPQEARVFADKSRYHLNRFESGHEPYNSDMDRDETGKFSSSGGVSTSVARGDDKVWKQSDGTPAPEHIQRLGIPPAWKDVVVDTDPNADLLVKGHDAKGRTQYIYSDRFDQQQQEAKFSRISELNDKIDGIRSENDANRGSDDPLTSEHADCMKLIMDTGIRPGSERETFADKTAYGATTLLGQHVVTDEDNNVRLQFVGKKGVDLDIPVDNKDTADMLVDRAKVAGQDGQLFPNIDQHSLSGYAHDLGDKSGYKTKDFRTLLATTTARDLVSQMEHPTSKTSYTKAVRSVARSVSERLGNTPTVALQRYIAPEVFTGWRSTAHV